MLNDPRFTAEVELTVPFHDVDMMGVVWHGNYFRYFEIAREALLNQFDYGYRQMKASGSLQEKAEILGVPVVGAKHPINDLAA